MARKGMKIRAWAGDDGKATLKAIIFHPMETGLRKDKSTGKKIPPKYITEANVEHNGKTILTCFWGPGVSKNPFISFDFNNAKSGDTVKIAWVDNTGDKDSKEATIG